MQSCTWGMDEGQRRSSTSFGIYSVLLNNFYIDQMIPDQDYFPFHLWRNKSSSCSFNTSVCREGLCWCTWCSKLACSFLWCKVYNDELLGTTEMLPTGTQCILVAMAAWQTWTRRHANTPIKSKHWEKRRVLMGVDVFPGWVKLIYSF